MMSRKAKTMITATVCGAALLIPISATGASAHSSHSGRHHGISRATLTDAQEAAKEAAEATFRASVKAAFAQYKADTVTQRADYKAARAAATTRAEKRAAWKAYLAATTTQRATLSAAIKTARDIKKAAIAAILAGS